MDKAWRDRFDLGQGQIPIEEDKTFAEMACLKAQRDLGFDFDTGRNVFIRRTRKF